MHPSTKQQSAWYNRWYSKLQLAGRLFQPAVQTNFKPCCGAVPADTQKLEAFHVYPNAGRLFQPATTHTLTAAFFAQARRRREIFAAEMLSLRKRGAHESCGRSLSRNAVEQLGCCTAWLLQPAISRGLLQPVISRRQSSESHWSRDRSGL